MKEINLKVVGMKCSGCENRIKNALLNRKEVKSVEANHETGLVHIVLKKEVTDEIKNEIVAAITRMDFEVNE